MLFRRTAKSFVTHVHPNKPSLFPKALASFNGNPNAFVTSFLPRVPKYLFSAKYSPDTKQKGKNVTRSQGQKLNEETSLLVQQGGFEEYMQSKTSRRNIDYTYNDKIMFEFYDDLGFFEGIYRPKAVIGALWGAASVLTYFLIHPWATIVPLCLTGVYLFQSGSSLLLRKNMISKIELIDSETIKVYPLSFRGDYLVCDIRDCRIFSVASLPREDTLSYAITVSLKELTTGKLYPTLIAYIHPDTSRVVNIDLLKSIVQGEVENVKKFKYVGKEEGPQVQQEEPGYSKNKKSNRNSK